VEEETFFEDRRDDRRDDLSIVGQHLRETRAHPHVRIYHTYTYAWYIYVIYIYILNTRIYTF